MQSSKTSVPPDSFDFPPVCTGQWSKPAPLAVPGGAFKLTPMGPEPDDSFDLPNIDTD